MTTVISHVDETKSDKSDKVLYKVRELSEDLVSENHSITIHGRIHSVRSLASVIFFVLRDQVFTIQCVLSKKNVTSKEQFINIQELHKNHMYQ